MQENRRWLSAISLTMLVALMLVLGIVPASADDDGAAAANVHVRQAETALRRNEYLKATIEYRKAAQQSESVALARKATRMGFSYGFSDEALLAAKRWIKLDKDSDEARAYLGQLYFRLGDLRNARRHFRRLFRDRSADVGEGLLSLVGYLSDEDDAEAADKLMRALAKPYRDSSLAHYAVAILALQAGDSTHARERAIRALELDPDNIRPQLLYARALLIDDEEDRAIEYLAHIIGDSERPNPDARMELALVYMLVGRDDDALSQANQVAREHGGRTDALRLIAIINFRLRRLDAAWDDFQNLLASGQYSMDALFYLARISDYREEYERAARLYREVHAGTNAVASQRRASVLLAHQLENADAAFELLDGFAQSSPDHAVDMVIAKARLLVSLKRYDEGLDVYAKAIEYRPDNENIVLGRAELLLRAGRLDEAIVGYRDAVKRWPRSAVTLNALGYTLADRTERAAEAEKLIRKALAYDPQSAAIIDSLGWVLYKLGRHEEALVELRRAFERLSDHEVASHLVEVLAVLERRDEALALLASAEERNPGSELLEDVRTRYFPETL
ncbi:MAG: tetratricopeptide repeat protein [Proteobacteria bacterium]|nr:tetratricopeptide repeat protein [Pseudomonadota bacterium]